MPYRKNFVFLTSSILLWGIGALGVVALGQIGLDYYRKREAEKAAAEDEAFWNQMKSLGMRAAAAGGAGILGMMALKYGKQPAR